MSHEQLSPPDEFEKGMIEAFKGWAKGHPYADFPVWFMRDGDRLTPYEISCEVEQRTKLGRDIVEIMRRFAEIRSYESLSPEGLILMFETEMPLVRPERLTGEQRTEVLKRRAFQLKQEKSTWPAR